MTYFLSTIALIAKQHYGLAMYLPAVLTLPVPLVSMICTAIALAITTHNAVITK